MAGVTDAIFRQLVKERGADVLVTEFVSADGVFQRNERTRRYLEFQESQRPLGVQLFGGNPSSMGQAARLVLDWVAPDFIDINFGCPVNKVVAKNGGSSLLKDCPLLQKVAVEVVHAAAPAPVTAKMRIGWDSGSINAVSVAKLLEGCGIQALAVHGRTRAQGYSGKADWDVIGEVASAVKIPVIGNGDLDSPAAVLRCQERYAVAGVMIGRAAMASPWLFEQCRAALDGHTIPPSPSLSDRWEFILRHCELAVQSRGKERPAMASMRARLMAYTKGLPEGRSLRLAFSQITSLAQLREIAEASLSASEQHVLEQV